MAVDACGAKQLVEEGEQQRTMGSEPCTGCATLWSWLPAQQFSQPAAAPRSATANL